MRRDHVVKHVVVIDEDQRVADLDADLAFREHLALLRDRALRCECHGGARQECGSEHELETLHSDFSIANLTRYRGSTGTVVGSKSLVSVFMNSTRSAVSCLDRLSGRIRSDRLSRST